MPRSAPSLTLSSIDEMDGIAFEHLVAELLSDRGYRAEVTQASGDFGVDVIARKGRYRYAIQVKRYKGSVPRTAVSDAVAGKYHWDCDKAWVITSGRFTKDARTLAASTDCQLTDRDDLGRWLEERRARAPTPSGRSRRLWRLIPWLLAILLTTSAAFYGWPFLAERLANRPAPLADPPISSDGTYTVECFRVDDTTVRCVAE
ncbi:MAG: restriction endonuclease [Trueperaceae bacterium]|nr:restriction endonuclease [Trueperaceae bacterium]